MKDCLIAMRDGVAIGLYLPLKCLVKPAIASAQRGALFAWEEIMVDEDVKQIY